MHRSKRFTDLSYWKASDFNFFFFHTGSLIFFSSFDLEDTGIKLFKFFLQLSVAVRLLYDSLMNDGMINLAEILNEFFLFCFVRVLCLSIFILWDIWCSKCKWLGRSGVLPPLHLSPHIINWSLLYLALFELASTWGVFR